MAQAVRQENVTVSLLCPLLFRPLGDPVHPIPAMPTRDLAATVCVLACRQADPGMASESGPDQLPDL